MKKILITGPESSGKSTLTHALSLALNGVMVPEFSRPFLEDLGRDYTEDDLLLIAKGQMEWEDKARQKKESFMISDTGLFNMHVWSQEKYGRIHPWIVSELKIRKYDLILLLHPDIPWEADPLRENESSREELFEEYKSLLKLENRIYSEINGLGEERLELAMELIRCL